MLAVVCVGSLVRNRLDARTRIPGYAPDDQGDIKDQNYGCQDNGQAQRNF